MDDEFRIRQAVPGDQPLLAEIYRQAIRVLGPGHYTAEQVMMWSRFGEDAEGFAQWMASGTTIVADSAAGPVGFGILQHTGRVAAVFVAPEAMRRGLGVALLTWMVAEARRLGLDRVTAEASVFSEGLFRRLGFAVVGHETVVRHGVAFERCCMALPLD